MTVPFKKLMICPWFGSVPPWFDLWHSSFEALKRHGYDLLFTTNLKQFNERSVDILGIQPPIEPGEAKVHDFRPTFGELFAEELVDYDFWGHTDLDCVYGRMERFLPDKELAHTNVYADCPYVCGPWTLYSNSGIVPSAFKWVPEWREQLQNPRTTGWAEGSFTRALEKLHEGGQISLKYGNLHRYGVEEAPRVISDGRSLWLDSEEIAMFHFRRTKEWPKNAR